METKLVIWKDGTYITVKNGITHEFENDKNWLTTIPIDAMEPPASQSHPAPEHDESDDKTELAKMFNPYCIDYFSKEPDNIREEKVRFAFDNKDKAFELFQSLYDTNYGTITIEDNLISIHTGGWSDNEELVSYFKNTFWWQTNLRLYATGGHYYFDTDRQNDNEWVINKSIHPSQPAGNGWVSVEDRLPEKESPKWNDSDYVLCCNEGLDNSFTFVGWYNHEDKKWTVAHHYATSESARVTHWQPLPTPPTT